MQLRKVNRYITLDEHNHIMRRCVSCHRWSPRRDYPLAADGRNHARECRECEAKLRVRDERTFERVG